MGGKRVAVIGAGIAGLAAALRLRQSGADVTVLEASDRVGGRMSTASKEGYLIERGAQLLTTAYANVLGLVRETGLEPELRRISPWVAMVRGQRPRRIPTGQLFLVYALASRLLGARDTLRFLWHTTSFRWPPADNYAAWKDYDDEDAARWCGARLGDALTYIVEPLIEGTLMQAPEETSRAAALAILALTDFGRSRQLTLARGLGSLPEALASRLDVKLEAPVRGIEVRDDGVEVRLAGETIKADYVVIAATAPAASGLYLGANELERRLMATTYSSTIKVSLATSRDWRDRPAFRKVWALLIPRAERGLVASVTIESSRDPQRVPSGELLNLFVAGKAAGEMMARSDDEIVAALISDIERYFPKAGSAKRFAQVTRWPEALPTSPVGRSRNLAEYRDSWRPERRLLLAGDYMGLPWLESAAETGAWAAARILAA